jgi:type VI secretion system protein ImpA
LIRRIASSIVGPPAHAGNDMATPDILDFEQLLRPISEAQPTGVELKEDDALRAVYQAVKDAREAARTAEKKLYQAAWLEEAGTASLDRPDWKKVHDLATETIAAHSKDLWVAAWLIEALTRLHGFAGLRDGFRLTRELVERFWDGLHPRPDEDGVATTVAQLTGLNGDDSEGALLAPIDRIPITAAGSLRAFSSADHKQAVELDKMTDTDKRAQRIADGAVSLEMFEKGVRETPPEFFRALFDDIQQAHDEFFQLGESLESHCGTGPNGYPAAPPTSAIRNALTDVRDRVQSFAQSVLGTSEPAPGAASASSASNVETPGGAGRTGMSRDEAFRQLQQVADFFRRTEPHSPVSYALEQAVRWGRMALPELLQELVSDTSVRDDLFRRMGIAPVEKQE